MSNAAAKNEIANIDPRAASVQAAQTPMHLLNQAVASGNIELAEKLMGLHERWEKNQARRSFDEAIAAAKAEIPTITRNATGHNSKRYADFAGIAKVVDPILSKHGLSYRFRSQQGERISVTCVLSHRDGHSEETTLTGPPDPSGNKNAIQAIGSTLTYLQRYSLVQMLGIAAANDDDGASAGIGEKISEEQLEKLQHRIAQVGVDIERYCAVMKVGKVEDTLAKDFQTALKHLDEVERYATQSGKGIRK